MQKKQMNVPFEIKSFEEEEKYFRIKGYGSIFGNVDLGKDIVEKGAFVDSLKVRMPKFLYQHDITKPLGAFDKTFEENKGLYFDGRMPKTISYVRDVAELVKMGVLGASIGYSVKDFERDGEYTRLKKLELWEISLVTIPMNPEAGVTDFKGSTTFQDLPLVDRDRAWDSNRAVARVRTFTDSVEEPSNTYRKAFFWYDGENAGNFTAYKLPYADVVDGALKAVPRAIFAAAAALSGARGGVDIPEADAEKVKNHVSRYYAKMRRQFNDEAIISPFEKQFTCVESVKDYSEYLKENYSLNKTERNDIIAKAKQALSSEFKKELEKVLEEKEKKEKENQIYEEIVDINKIISKI